MQIENAKGKNAKGTFLFNSRAEFGILIRNVPFDSLGDSLHLDYFHKVGYRFFVYQGTPKTDFYYFTFSGDPPYKPDCDHPVVYPAWKCHGYEPLVEHPRIDVPAGTWYGIDLITGRVEPRANPSADLRVKLAFGDRPGGGSAWSLTAQAADGGLVPAPGDSPPWEAAASGYTPSVSIDGAEVNRPHYPCYYVKSRNGQVFSFVGWSVWVDSKGGRHLIISATSNPRGSRVLEPKPDDSPRRPLVESDESKRLPRFGL